MSIVLGFLFVIGVLVFIHELGHFLVAKWSGVRVEKFSLGFGKKIFAFRRGETEYLISMLPLGGYVKMYGESGEGGIIVEDVEAGSNAQKLGFLSGDKITKIDGNELKEFSTWKGLLNKLKVSEEKEHEYLIERDEERIRLNGNLEDIEGIIAFSEKEYKRGFSNQPLLNRFLIVVAGPFMNFFIPFIFFPIVLYIGIAQPAYLDKLPEVGYIQPDSEAAKAGFQLGDKILKINNKPVKNWKEATIAFQINPDSIVSVTVDRGGFEKDLSVKTTASKQGIVAIGIAEPLEAIVGNVGEGTPAKQAGLQRGDKIVQINDTKITDWYQMSSIIKKNAAKETTFVINREGKDLTIMITPDTVENNQGQIGIGPFQEQIIQKYGFFESIIKGIQKAYEQIIEITVLLLGFLYKLVTGAIPLSTAGKTIAGPLLIAQVSGAAAESGIATLLQFTSFISINLAIINLFPIPMLDGGHVVYITLEAIRRRPLSQKTMEYSQRVGFSFLILLMFLAVFNDISRLKGDIIRPVKRLSNI
jgi:regulator of sigma E protease